MLPKRPSVAVLITRSEQTGYLNELYRRVHFQWVIARRFPMTYFIWLVFIFSAILEVGGDAVIRKGLRGNSLTVILMGCALLGCYGVVVNTVKWDFSKLLGVYVAIFALISALFGKFMFRENIPTTTWIGLAVIIVGAMIIQFGNRI
jgi:drug/metabolite transporter superfamily protein YnfA